MRFVIAAAFCLAAAISPQPLHADGMMIWGDESAEWDYAPEAEQEAVLKLENGRENLLLRVRVGEESDKGMLWIFPVPAKPAQVRVDVTKAFERPYGEDLDHVSAARARAAVDYAMALHPGAMFADTWPLLADTIFMMPTFGLGELSSDMEGELGHPGVEVHSHVEKRGLTVEVLTAKDAEALKRYLTSKRIRPGPVGGSTLARYIGKDYCFVATWKGKGLAGEASLGLSVDFPAKRLFFPLMPTSVYGARHVPVDLQAYGLRAPVIPDSLRPYTRVNYQLGQGSPSGDDARYLTGVRIDAPASAMMDDLWIEPEAPASVLRHARWLRTLDSPFALLALVAFCFLFACAVAGLSVFPDMRNRRGALKLACMWLFGSVPWLGWAVGLPIIPTLPAPETSRNWRESWKARALDWRKLDFVPICGAVFLLAVQAAAALFGQSAALDRQPNFASVSFERLASSVVLFLWAQAAAFFSASGGKESQTRLGRAFDWLWAGAALNVVIEIGNVLTYPKAYPLFGAMLPPATQFAIDFKITYVLLSALIGVAWGCILLMPAFRLARLAPGEAGKAAWIGAIWGLFITRWPYSAISLIGPAVGALFGWTIVALRAAWSPRDEDGTLKRSFWAGTLGSLLVIGAAYDVVEYRGFPNASWPPLRLVEALGLQQPLADQTAMFLIDRLDSSGRAAALQALLDLERSGGPRARDSARWVLCKLGRKDDVVARVLAEEGGTWEIGGLWGSEDSTVLKFLENTLRSTSPAVSEMAFAALQRYPSSQEVLLSDAYKAHKDVDALAKDLFHKRWEFLEQRGLVPAMLRAAEAPRATVNLQNLLQQSRRSPEVVAMLRRVASTQPERRGVALRLLGVGEAAGFRPLILKQLSAPQPQPRLEALSLLDWLAKNDDTTVVPTALKMLGDPSSEVQQRSAEILGRRNAASAVPLLVRNLKAPDARARRGAIDALTQLGAFSPDVIDSVVWVLKNDHDEYNRGDAAIMLGRTRKAELVSFLAAALNDPSYFVRRQAISALGYIGPGASSAVPAIIGVVDHDSKDRFFVKDYQTALVRIGTPEAVEAAERLKR